MKTRYLLPLAAILSALAFHTTPAAPSLDSQSPELNNPNPQSCGVSLELPDSLLPGDPFLKQVFVRGSAGDAPATLMLRVTSGGDRIGNKLWLDAGGTLPADDLEWPVAANTTRNVTLYVRGVETSVALGDVRMKATMSCGAEANDATTVVRPCGVIEEPAFPGPKKWFYADKVEIVNMEAFGRVLYKVTWIPPDAVGLYDAGGSCQPNVKEFNGNVGPEPVVWTYHLGPRIGRLWVTKSFTCHYTDPCGAPGIKMSDSTVGWALLGLEGPIVNGGRGDRNGGGGDDNEGINFPPPPPPDDHGQDGKVIDDPVIPTDWIGECEDPKPDNRMAVPLAPAEGIEIIAEEIVSTSLRSGFSNPNVPDEEDRRFLTMTGTAKIVGSISGVTTESSGVMKVCRGTGNVIVSEYDGDPALNPFDQIDQNNHADWNATENTVTSHGGEFCWEVWNTQEGQMETMTWSFHWTLSDPYDEEMVRADAIAKAWEFRDIYQIPPGHNLDYPTFHGCRAQFYSDGDATAYGKLRYRIRVPEDWHRPLRVSWVERFSPAGQVHFDGQVRDGEEYVIKTALIPEGESATGHFGINPATMPDKQGEWDVYLLRVEDASVAYDTAAREFVPIAEGIPDSGRMPELGISITGTERLADGQHRVSVAVEYEDPHGDMSGTPANDILEFLVDGNVVDQLTGLSADTGGEIDAPWKVKNSKRTLNYKYTVPAKQGITTLSVRTVPDDGMEAAAASTGVVLDFQPEGTQASAAVNPQLTTDGSFDSGAVDQLGISFPGGALANLVETGPDTLVFTGQATVAGATKAVSLALEARAPAEVRLISARMEIGIPADTYQIEAYQAPDGQSLETLSIHRVITSPASELPVIHLASSPDPAVLDSMGVVFPGGPLATLQETAVDSEVFAGQAVVSGVSSQTTVMFGDIHRPAAGSPALLCASVHLQSGSAHYVESIETAADSGEFGIAYSQPLATPATTAVSSTNMPPTDPLMAGSVPFMLRYKVPAFLTDQIESGEISIWLDDNQMPGEADAYYMPDEERNEEVEPVVCVMDGPGAEIFTWSRVGTEIVSSPSGIICGESFEITFRKDGETVWSQTYSLASQAPEPTIPRAEPTFEDQVAGYYMVCYSAFGQALLKSYEDLGGTIRYVPQIPGNFKVLYISQKSWDTGKKPVIGIDSTLKPFEAAAVLYHALRRAFNPAAGVSARDLQDAWKELAHVPPHLQTELVEAARWRGQWVSSYVETMEVQLKTLAAMAEMGFRITLTPVDIVITLGESAVDIQDGRYAQAGFNLATALPGIGEVSYAMGLAVVIRVTGTTARITGDGVRVATELIGLASLSGRIRPQIMREIRIALDNGTVTRQMLEEAYDSGCLRFVPTGELLGPNQYHTWDELAVLREGTVKRTGRDKFLDEQTHHELPLQHRRDFLIRGIDPNDGEIAGWFVNEKYHQNLLHGGKNITEFGKGGAWNYQWKRFFQTTPDADAAAIFGFRDDLWARVKEIEPDTTKEIDAAANLWQEVDWPFPPGE